MQMYAGVAILFQSKSVVQANCGLIELADCHVDRPAAPMPAFGQKFGQQGSAHSTPAKGWPHEEIFHMSIQATVIHRVARRQHDIADGRAVTPGYPRRAEFRMGQQCGKRCCSLRLVKRIAGLRMKFLHQFHKPAAILQRGPSNAVFRT